MEKKTTHVFAVFGTRPEAIKFASVVRALRKRDIRVSVILFRQHGKMLDEALAAFDLKPTHDLGVIFSDKAIFDKGMSIVRRMANMGKGGLGLLKFLRLLRSERPDLLLVQGDTSTAFFAALIAFYMRIPVGHIEAGLRTHDRKNPFPEETNRELIARLADLHFAPTEPARENLLRENVRAEAVYVTGNTAIDSMLWMLGEHGRDAERRALAERALADSGVPVGDGERLVLFTAHRRESFGEPLLEMMRAAKEIAERHSDVRIVYPVHPNPNVQRAAQETLANVPGVVLTGPIAYEPFAIVMSKAYLILTDSGGIQEEASVFGIPVLVMREATERAEGFGGNVRLIGRKREDIVREASKLLDDPEERGKLAKKHAAFGSGHAAELIAEHIDRFLNGR